MRPRVVMVMMVMVMPVMRRIRRSHPCQHHHRDRNSDNPNHKFRTPGKEICPPHRIASRVRAREAILRAAHGGTRSFGATDGADRPRQLHSCGRRLVSRDRRLRYAADFLATRID
jgi:hypothetical protein